MKKKYYWWLLLVLVIFLIVLGFLYFKDNDSYKHKSANEIKTVKIGILNVPNDVAVVRSNGSLNKALKKYGYRAKFIVFDSGVDANKALMSGSIDMATMGDTNAVIALDKHIPVKLVWVNDVIEKNEALIVKNNSHINSLNDLSEHMVATPFACTSQYSLETVLNLHHIKKVKLMDMDTQDIVSAWERGDIKAAYTWEPTLSQLKKDGHVLISSKTLHNEGYLTANVTLMRNQFITEHHIVALAIINCLSKMHRDYNSNLHKSKIYADAAKQVDIPISTAKTMMSESQYPSIEKEKQFNNKIFPKSLLRITKFLIKNQAINRNLSNRQIKHFLNIDLIK